MLFSSSSIILSVILWSSCSLASTEMDRSAAELGRLLFHDQSLSRDGNQSCATCHDENHAFIDPRENQTSHIKGQPGSVSLGQDGQSLGDINAPSAAYAAYAMDFIYDVKEGNFRGGLFYDGRAQNLIEQAKQPFLNPLEMQSDINTVVNKVKQKYREAMQSIYGDDIFTDSHKAFHAIASSIAAFERTDHFAPFDSRFDRMLKGQEQLTAQEQQGLELFKDEDKGNCASCHPVPKKGDPKQLQLFTDFTYNNLGVPPNRLARQHNGLGESHSDLGLYNNPLVVDEDLKGAFRVPGLRNIAVTAPYMHNGVLQSLEAVVHFYNSANLPNAINPETGKPWDSPEVAETRNIDELGDLGLNDDEIAAIVAFLKTLTDQRYEHLIK